MSKTYFIPPDPPAVPSFQWKGLPRLHFTRKEVEVCGLIVEVVVDIGVPEDSLIVLDRRVADALYPRRRRDD